MGRFIDLTGRRFGKLMVIGQADRSCTGRLMWLCRCDCGNETIVFGDNLNSGHTVSCGCFQEERVKTHGESYTRLYRIWALMKRRCLVSDAPDYQRYGGRGICVCEEWRASYEAFRDWALANGYSDKKTLDRRDNDGDYEPSNCRWATRKEQQNNTRVNRRITYQGETLTIAQWADKLGLEQETLRTRIRRHWSIERALTTPTVFRRKKHAE